MSLLKRELDLEIAMNIEQALQAMFNLDVSLSDYDSEALEVMCAFVHDTLQREKLEYEACEEHTRRKEEGI